MGEPSKNKEEVRKYVYGGNDTPEKSGTVPFVVQG